jgi:methanogenic corrinoid protein MtbC1
VKDLVSPKQVARAIGVSESSLKRWCDLGLIQTVRTAGGHRRMPIAAVVSFIQKNHHTLVDPELLGLPASSGIGARTAERGRVELRDALLAGDETRARSVVFDCWLAGRSIAEICDGFIAAAFTEIGELWACREADVYQERRACEIAIRILHEVRGGLPAGDLGWTALGGTIEGDQYLVPTTMAEVVLQEAGWTARSLGASVPISSLVTAIRENRPRLFWVSVSFIADEREFFEGIPTLSDAASESGTELVLGGAALTESVLSRISNVPWCDTMQALGRFAADLRQATSR